MLATFSRSASGRDRDEFLGMLALDCWGAVGGGADEVSVVGAVIVALILKNSSGCSRRRERHGARVPGHWKYGRRTRSCGLRAVA
jgi:hypothetical protein